MVSIVHVLDELPKSFAAIYIYSDRRPRISLVETFSASVANIDMTYQMARASQSLYQCICVLKNFPVTLETPSSYIPKCTKLGYPVAEADIGLEPFQAFGGRCAVRSELLQGADGGIKQVWSGTIEQVPRPS